MTDARGTERLRKAAGAGLAVSVLIVVGVAIAQWSATSPAAAPNPAEEPQGAAPTLPARKPSTPTPPAAEAQPAPAAPAPHVATSPSWPEMPQFIYSPWAKFCGKGQDRTAKQVCFTGKDARTAAGQPVVAAALIEPEGACASAQISLHFKSFAVSRS